ncbi:hypothetical protein V6N13_030041 [Hibiscus sabdariffa]
MPPKQQAKSKADLAKKQKVVEDKTFGSKNKNKSKNVQKYVQNLQQSVQPKPDPSKAAAKVCKYFLEAVERNSMVGSGMPKWWQGLSLETCPSSRICFEVSNEGTFGGRDRKPDRAKNDRMSGRELFLSDASLFVDDAEAYEEYRREKPEITEQKVILLLCLQ